MSESSTNNGFGSRFDNGQPTRPTEIKVKTLAQEVRARAISAYGEKAFARMCLDFEKAIILDSSEGEVAQEGEEWGEGDDLTRQALGLLKLLGQPLPPEEEGRVWQLAFVWLDGRGWGELGLVELKLWVKRLHQPRE